MESIPTSAWELVKATVPTTPTKTRKPRGPAKPKAVYEVIGRLTGSANEYVIGEVHSHSFKVARQAAWLIATMKGMKLVAVRPVV